MLGRVGDEVVPGHGVGEGSMQHAVHVLDRLRREPRPDIGGDPATTEPQYRGPGRVDGDPGGRDDLCRRRALSCPPVLMISPVGVHQSVAVDLDPAFGEQSPVEQVERSASERLVGARLPSGAQPWCRRLPVRRAAGGRRLRCSAASTAGRQSRGGCHKGRARCLPVRAARPRPGRAGGRSHVGGWGRRSRE